MSSSDNYPPYYPRPIIEDQKLPLSSPGDHHSFSFSPQNHTGGFSPQPQRWTYASAGTSYPATLPHEYRIPANGMVIDSNEHTSRNSVTEATSLLAPGIIPMAPGTVDVSTAGRSATSAVLGQTYSSAVGGRVHGQGYLSHGKKDNGHQTVALAMSNYISSRHQSQSYQQQQSQRIGQPSNPQQFNTLAQQYAQEPATYRSSNSALALSSSPYSKPSLPSQLHANKRSGERRRTQQPQMTNICQVSEQLSQLQQQSQPDKEDRFPRLVPAVSSAASSPDVYQNSISSTTPCVSVGVCLSVGLYPTVLQQQSTDTPTESLVGGPTQLSPQLSSAQSQAMEAERDHMASRNQVAQHQHHPHGLVSLLAAHSKSVSTFPELQSMIKIPQGHCQQPPERLNSQQAPVTQRPHSQQANQLTAQNQQQQLERERHQIDRQRQLDQVQLWQEQEQQYRKEKHRQEQPRQHKQKEEEWNGERRQVQMRLKQDVQHQAQDRSTLKNRTSPTGMQEISELKPRLYLPEPALPKSLATKPLNPVVKDKYSLPRSELQEGSGELYQRPTCQTLRRNAQSLQPLPQVQTTSQSETDTEPQSPYSSAHTQAHQLHNLSPEMIIYPPPPTGQPKNQQPQIGTPHVQQQYQLQQHQMHQYQNQPQLIPTSTPFVLSLAGEHDESQPLHDIQHSQQHLQENNEAYQHTANSIPSIPTLDGQDPVDRAFMEKRMRELVDTMRFYQSKDPSAFHSVWESVRKETGEPPPLTPGGDPSFPQRAKPIGIDIGPSAPPAALVAQKLCNAQSTQRQHQDSGLDLTGAKPTASMSPRQQQLHLPTLPSRQPQPQPESQMSLPPEVRWLRKYPTKQNFQQIAKSGVNCPSFRTPQPRADPPNPTQADGPRGMPDPEKAVVAAAASEFLTRFGKPISAQYISGFLRHSNNFVTMCEHFDSLGHKFDRGDLARFLLDSVNREQIKQMDSVLPTSVPAHPLSQESKERGRVLGEVEDHQEQQQQESNSAARFLPHGPSTSVETYNVPIALCQVVPYSTHTQSSESANSLTPQRKSKKGGERVRTLPGSVPKWQRVNSAPPVVVTSAAVTRQLPGTVSASQPVSIPDNSPQALHRNSSPFSILSNNHPPLVIAHQQFPGRLFSTANLMNIQNEALRSSGTHQSIFGQSVSTPVCNFPIDNLAIVQDSPTNPVSLEGLNLPDTGQATVGEASGYENDLNPKELQSAEPSVAAPNIPTLSVQVPNDSIASATSESGRTGINNLAASPIAIFSGLPTTAGVGSIIIDLTTTLDSAVSTPEHAVNVTRKLQEFKQPLATMISRKKAARVTKYNPTDIARSILIVARKHPTERSLNSHLLELKENLPGHIDWNSDLETIRWDILDPDPVGVDDYINGDHEGDRNNSPISSEKSINGNGISTKPTLSILKKRRRGGPQRIRKSLLQDQMSQARPASTEIRLDHLTEQPAPQFTPSNATSSRRLQSNHNDSIHSPSRQTAVMESSPISKRRRTGQPTRLMQQNGANYTGNAVFKKYRCKWKDCNADLHNIENLKRHIINLHKGKNNNMESYPCYWMGCFRPQLNGVKAWKNRLHPMIWDFASERDWQNHVDRHVDTVKHAYGVGPAALFSDQESGVSDVDYLSDHNGQQVTPMARQSNPSYKFVPPLGFRPTKQFKIAHGITTPDRRTTMASYRQTLERLRILGAGMEGDEVEELLVFDGGQGIHTESKRIVPASWPPKPRISTSVIT